MAESDGQEKTEQPTEQRLRQAREKGQIPRSKELGTAAVLLSAALGLMMVGDSLGLAMARLFERNFQVDRAALFDPEAMMPALRDSLMGLLWPLLGFFAIVLVAALVGNSLLGAAFRNFRLLLPDPNVESRGTGNC